MSAYQGNPVARGLHPVIARLVQARKDRNLSQAVLAERLDIAQGTLSRWENGTRTLTFADVVRWAAALGLCLDVAEPQIADGPLPELVAGGLA